MSINKFVVINNFTNVNYKFSTYQEASDFALETAIKSEAAFIDGIFVAVITHEVAKGSKGFVLRNVLSKQEDIKYTPQVGDVFKKFVSDGKRGITVFREIISIHKESKTLQYVEYLEGDVNTLKEIIIKITGWIKWTRTAEIVKYAGKECSKKLIYKT